MTYEIRPEGFESFRIRAAAGARIFVPGAQTWVGNVPAVTAPHDTTPCTLDSMTVELPDTLSADLIELYDIQDVTLMAAATPVLVLRPWGSATQGTYTVLIHRVFRFGFVVHCNTMVTADVNFAFAPNAKLRFDHSR